MHTGVAPFECKEWDVKDEVGPDLKPLGAASHFIPIIFLSLRFIQSASVLASAGACCRSWLLSVRRSSPSHCRDIPRFSKTPLATPLGLWQVASGGIARHLSAPR